MNVAKQLVTKAINEQKIKPLIDAGFTKAWLNDPDSRTIFDGDDRTAYIVLLDFYKKYNEVPDWEYLHDHWNPAYLPEETDRSMAVLLDEAAIQFRRGMIDIAVGDFVAAFDEDEYEAAVGISRDLVTKVDRIGREERTSTTLNEAARDLEAFLDRDRGEGIPTGIESLDESFGGLRPGQLITLLGRYKSMKSWLMVKMSITAYLNGYDSLFFSVEMGTEEIMERQYAALAGISHDRMVKQKLEKRERIKLLDVGKRLADDPVKLGIEQDIHSFTVSDVRKSIRASRPHIVFIDGFYFMTDEETGESGTSWKAHENLAKALAILAGQEQVVIVVSTQVQEKQHNSKSGIESHTMMAGTGLLRATHLLIGVDKPDKISNIQKLPILASRVGSPEDTALLWDFSSMSFEEVSIASTEVDEDLFND